MENLEKYIKNVEKYNIFYFNQFETIITLKNKNDDFNKNDFINLIKSKKYDVLTDQRKITDKATELTIVYSLEYIAL